MKRSFLLLAVLGVTLTGCGENGLRGCFPGTDGCGGKVVSKPVDKPVNVTRVELTRKTINLGESTDLVITIDKPAPSGGYSFAVNSESEGAEATFNPILTDILPRSSTILKGDNKTSIHLQTQRVRGAAKSVMFYVGTRLNPIGDTLTIN